MYSHRNRKVDVPIYFDSKPEKPLIIEKWEEVCIDGVVPGYYLVSNTGKVINIKGQLISPQLINSGYLVYRLYTGDKNKKYKHILAHRLVMLTFHPIDNPDQMTVNHNDMNSYNNWDTNLQWMTQAENNEEKNKILCLSGTGNYQAKFNIDQLRIIVRELHKGTSYKEILNMIGIEDTDNNRDYIGNIKRGKTYQNEIKYYQLDRFID